MTPRYLITKQVADMACCSERTVERACAVGKMKATKAADPRSKGDRRRRYKSQHKFWQINVSSGRKWADLYQPWGRFTA